MQTDRLTDVLVHSCGVVFCTFSEHRVSQQGPDRRELNLQDRTQGTEPARTLQIHVTSVVGTAMHESNL